jgi:hypothetical protein
MRSLSPGSLYVGGRSPQHKQRGGCLQLAQTWPNFWQLKQLGEGGLGLVCLYLDANVAEAREFEYFLGFLGPWEGN